MADQTHIEWTDATWNIVTGCSVVSPGCTNCYAMRLAGVRMQHHPSRAGLTLDTKAGPVWNGQVRFNDGWLKQPLGWKKPRRIFVCAHGDLFHEGVPDGWLDQIFAVMALCPQHTFQILTKRPARAKAYIDANRHNGCGLDRELGTSLHNEWERARRERRDLPVFALPLPNVWLGVSVEDQVRADERIPILLDTPAAVRWISAEPLLGPIDLTGAWHGESAVESECWGECGWCAAGHPALHNCQRGRQSDLAVAQNRSGLDWVVVGGESGPGARPMHPDWVRQIRDDCAAAGVPFLFKQWGNYLPDDDNVDVDGLAWQAGSADPGVITWPDGLQSVRLGKKQAGRSLDRRFHDGYPEPRHV